MLAVSLRLRIKRFAGTVGTSEIAGQQVADGEQADRIVARGQFDTALRNPQSTAKPALPDVRQAARPQSPELLSHVAHQAQVALASATLIGRLLASAASGARQLIRRNLTGRDVTG